MTHFVLGTRALSLCIVCKIQHIAKHFNLKRNFCTFWLTGGLQGDCRDILDFIEVFFYQAFVLFIIDPLDLVN